ncbi:TlpA family protein disulfide reductase [Chitinophaga solisilvae]|uniref:TlpA family protein disulfide reductase n=1 Tax=Chitinophaga solisilvae TaxID=1233460 RepID=UPI00136C982F|nr:TlpA disulfide reductase family protein [Chitinophaga solisilvae]
MKKPFFSFSNIAWTLLLGALLTVAVVPAAKVWALQQLMKIGLFQPDIPAETAAMSAAPDMVFRNAAGAPVSTLALKGKVILINFWASWCPPCRAEMPSLHTLYGQWKNNPDIVFLTVNADGDIAAAEKFMQDNGYALPVVIPAGSIPSNVYTGTLPTTLIIDKAGRLVLRKTGVASFGSERLQHFLQQQVSGN